MISERQFCQMSYLQLFSLPKTQDPRPEHVRSCLSHGHESMLKVMLKPVMLYATSP